MRSEARFTAPRPDCPHPERWNAHDADGTEIEVIEMVAGLVRGTQPSVVLETGTHLGYMAEAIGIALWQNGQGRLHTYEPDGARHAAASERCRRLPVTLHNDKSMVPWEHGTIDFAWFDSLLPLRAAEFDFYLPHMSPNAVVGFHDAGPHHGPWSDVLRSHPRLTVIDMPTPRGMLLGRPR